MTADIGRPAEPLNILLVEDSEDDIFFFQRSLERSGLVAQLNVAEDGAKAIDFLTHPNGHASPDVIFLDLKMPNVNGFEVLEWLKGHSFDPPPKVIILTSSEEPSDLQRAAQFGVQSYLIKPLSPVAVRNAIQSAIK